MRTILLALASVTSAVAAPLPKFHSSPMEAELAKLQGTWRAISYEYEGTKLGADQLKDSMLITFQGAKCTLADGSLYGTFDLDPTATPKLVEIALAPAYGDKASPGIYKLDGDTFTCCSAEGKFGRPNVFLAANGSGHMLIVYERVKVK